MSGLFCWVVGGGWFVLLGDEWFVLLGGGW